MREVRVSESGEREGEGVGEEVRVGVCARVRVAEAVAVGEAVRVKEGDEVLLEMDHEKLRVGVGGVGVGEALGEGVGGVTVGRESVWVVRVGLGEGDRDTDGESVCEALRETVLTV